MTQTPYGIKSERLYRMVKPVRDRKYRKWLKSLWCLGCGQNWGLDACHTGPHALSRKGCDMLCIPLCRPCHEEFDANPQDFAWGHGRMILAEVIQFLNAQYKAKMEAA